MRKIEHSVVCALLAHRIRRGVNGWLHINVYRELVRQFDYFDDGDLAAISSSDAAH